MLGNVKKLVATKQIKKKLDQYNIKLVHFIPGRIRLQSTNWKANTTLINQITEQLQSQPFIYSAQATQETGSLLITYNTGYLTTLDELEQWLQFLDRLYFGERSRSAGGVL